MQSYGSYVQTGRCRSRKRAASGRFVEDLNVCHVNAPSQVAQSRGNLASGRATRRWERSLTSLTQLESNDSRETHLLKLKRYSTAITSCGAAWSHAAQLFRRILLRHLQLDIMACSQIATCCQRAFVWRRALVCLRLIALAGLREDIVAYNSALGRSVQWQVSMALFTETERRRLRQDAYSLSAALRSLSSNFPEWRLASSLQEHARAASLRANTVCKNSALHAMAESSQWRWCSQVLHDSVDQRYVVDAVSLTSAVQACGKAAVWKQALNILQSAVGQLGQICRDVIMYNASISSLAAGGHWHAALSLFLEIKAGRMQPDATTCTSVVTSCKQAKQAGVWVQAIFTYANARSRAVCATNLAKAKASEAGSASSASSAVTAVLAVCEQAKQWQQAVVLLTEAALMRASLDVLFVNVAISTCDRVSMFHRALLLLDACGDWLVQPDVVSYNTAISSLGKAARWQQVVQRLGIMFSKQLLPDAITCASLISASEPARWQHALAMTQLGCLNVQADIILFNSAMSAVEKMREWCNALGLQEEAFRVGIRCDEFTYSAATSACAVAAVWTRALAMVGDSMSVHAVHACNAAITSCEPTSRWQLGAGILQDAAAHNLAADCVTFNSAVRCYRWAGMWQWACHLLMDGARMRVSTVATCSDAVESCEVAQSLEAARSARSTLRRIETFGLRLLRPLAFSCSAVSQKASRRNSAPPPPPPPEEQCYAHCICIAFT